MSVRNFYAQFLALIGIPVMLPRVPSSDLPLTLSISGESHFDDPDDPKK